MLRILVPFILFVTLPTVVEAQYTYNWSTGERTLAEDPLRAGKRVDIVVEGLNPLCYSSNVTARITEVEQDYAEFMAAISPEDSGTTPDPVPAASDTGATFMSVAVEAYFGFAPSFRDELAEAASAVTLARTLLDTAESIRAQATSDADRITNPPCAWGRRWDAAAFLDQAADRAAGLEAALESARTDHLPVARDYIDHAHDLLEGLTADTPAQEDSLAVEQRRVAEARELATKIEAALPATATAYGVAAARLPALAAATRMQTSVHATQNAENLRLLVKATPLPGLEGMVKADSVVLTEHIHRRFRSFVSTGVFISLMDDARNYSRVNRPARADSLAPDSVQERVQRDSTYSTYAAVNRSVMDVVSPTIQFNMSFADVTSGVPLLLSFGVAARTVNGATLPEPFAGASLGLNDRFVISTGVHFGRTEDLLIATSDRPAVEIANGPVPTAVTEADAIGVEWKSALFLTLSIRP